MLDIGRRIKELFCCRMAKDEQLPGKPPHKQFKENLSKLDHSAKD